MDSSSRTRSFRILRLYRLLVPRSRPKEPVDPQSSPVPLPPPGSAVPTAGFPVLGFLLTPSPTSPIPGDRLDPGPAPWGWGDPPPPPGEALRAGAGPAGPRGLRGRRPLPEARPPPTRSPGWRHHGPRAEPEPPSRVKAAARCRGNIAGQHPVAQQPATRSRICPRICPPASPPYSSP